MTWSDLGKLCDDAYGRHGGGPEFRKYLKNGCRNCYNLRRNHVSGSKCLFGPTKFVAWPDSLLITYDTHINSSVSRYGRDSFWASEVPL